MPIYAVTTTDGQITVEQFLSRPGVVPPIQNPSVRIPQLIRLNGIIHYTRSNTRTVVSSGDYQIQQGDFLVVADQIPTGQRQVLVAPFRASDYAFIMGSGDDFYSGAENFMSRRSTTNTITSSRSLESVLNTLVLGQSITTPISNVIIVSHAREEGVISFTLNDADRDNKIYIDELCMYVHNTRRPQITPRTVRNNSDTNIYIRGCNIGRSSRFLSFIRHLFGNQVTVTAPKHEDIYFEFSLQRTMDGVVASETTYYLEFMRYNFVMLQKNRVRNKDRLVQLFDDRAYQDIHGQQITRAQWTAWIPRNIHQDELEVRYRCNNPIHASMGIYIKRRFRYRHRPVYLFGLQNWVDEGSPPARQSERIEILRRELRGTREMQDTFPSEQCPYPRYHRWGYTNLDNFIDSLNWSFNWNRRTRILECRGSIHEYQLRIPITDADNNLMINAFLSTGDRQYLHHDIIETNGELFGRVP